MRAHRWWTTLTCTPFIRIVSTACVLFLASYSSVSAITYPAPPAGEYEGGLFNYYFQNMFRDPCPPGRAITDITSTGTLICVGVLSQESDPKVNGPNLTTNYLTKWGGSTLLNSQIFDNGAWVGIATADPTSLANFKLSVGGNVNALGFNGNSLGLNNDASILGNVGVGAVYSSTYRLYVNGDTYTNRICLGDGECYETIPDPFIWGGGGGGGSGTGTDGWEPHLAVINDPNNPNRRVLQLVDWFGGTGTKPTQYVGQYLSPFGYTTNASAATDIRGPSGQSTFDGSDGYLAQFASGGTYVVNSALFQDGAGNVGVGTATPGAKLDVSGEVSATAGFGGKIYMGGDNSGWDFEIGSLTSGSNLLTFYNRADGRTMDIIASGARLDGRVAIGKPAPSYMLDVNGQINGSSLCISGDCKTNWASVGITSSAGANYVTKSNGSGLINSQIFDNGTNVGVGTSSPGSKLDVSGNINASGFCIAGDCKTAWSQVVTSDSTKANLNGGNTFNGDQTVNNNLNVNWYVQVFQDMYARSNINVLNKAGNGWLPFAQRDTSRSEAGFAVKNTTSLDIVDAGANAGDQLLRVGDDAYLTDVDAANTLGIYGSTNSNIGAIRLGAGGGTVSGANGNVVIGGGLVIPTSAPSTLVSGSMWIE